MKFLVKCAIKVNAQHNMSDVIEWCIDEFGSDYDRWGQIDDTTVEFYHSINDANLFLIYWDSTVIDSVIEDRYTATIIADTLFTFD